MINVTTGIIKQVSQIAMGQESGGSEKHFIDAERVYEVQHEVIDGVYLDGWGKELGVEEFVARLRNEAELP